MKKIILGIIIPIIMAGCYADKGNYDYREINELTVEHPFFKDTTLRLYSFVDILEVNPEITAKHNYDEANYEYEWRALGTTIGIEGEYLLGREKNLVYPIALPAQSYSVFFIVTDKTTGYQSINRISMTLVTSFQRGWVLLGEGDDGLAQLDMVTTGGTDTLTMKNILENAELDLGKPTMLLVPPYRPQASLNYIFVGTDKGSYRLYPGTMSPLEAAHMKWSFFDMSSIGECVLNDAVQVMGYMRAMIVDGNLHAICGMTGSTGNLPSASNRYKGEYELFPIGDKIGYGPRDFAQHMVLYNTRDKRFVYQGGLAFNAPKGYCVNLSDKVDDPYSWETGLDYVTTINTRLAPGWTYTILKDDTDFYLYTYRVTSSLGTLKGLRVKMDNAIDLDKAEFFGGSNIKTVIYYTVGNKLYGYDYSLRKCTLLKTFEGYEVTCLHGDILAQTSADYFYVALYDPAKPASTGGTILKYSIVDDVNDIIIEEQPVRWEGICKVKSMGYKSN